MPESRPLVLDSRGNSTASGESSMVNSEANDLPESAYCGRNGDTMADMWRHLSSMGHTSRVNCVTTTLRARFIITGGVDCTMRVFRFDKLYDAYLLVAVLTIEPLSLPSEHRHWKSRKQPKEETVDVDWDLLPPHGITAVATTQSARTRRGKEVRIGPFLAGTSDGQLCIMDMCAASNRCMTVTSLHKGQINDICVAPTYPGKNAMASTGGDMLVVTAGADCMAKMMRMEVKEHHQSPDFLNIPCAFEKSRLLDCLLFGGGWPLQCELDDNIMEATMSAAMSDDMPMLVDPELGRQDEAEISGWLKLVGIEEVRGFKHSAPVLSIKHLGDNRDIEARAMFASLTSFGVTLWSIQGRQLLTLSISARESPRMDSASRSSSTLGEPTTSTPTDASAKRKHIAMDTAINNEEGLLIVAGDAHVAVWGLQAGIVGTKAGRVLDYDPASWKQKTQYSAAIDPMCVYDQRGRLLCIDQSCRSTKFVVQAKNDYTCTMWSTQAVSPGKLALEGAWPGALFLAPGQEEATLDLMHEDKVNAMKVIQDRNDPYLITACDDGTVFMWDLEGHDRGQIVQEMRSLTAPEVIIPPILMVIGGLQILSFAFTKPIPWEENTHSFMSILHKILLWDLSFFHSEQNKVSGFWQEMFIVCTTIFLFIVLAATGAPPKLDEALRNARSSKIAKKEKTGFGPALLKVKLTKLLRNFVYLFLEVVSTVCVAPLFMKIAQATGCYRPFGTPWTDYLGNPNHRIRLSHVAEIRCMEGSHLLLVMYLLVAVPLFIWILIPYSTCLGDAHYVPPEVLFGSGVSKRAWRQASIRKASALHMGFLHLTPRYAFRTQLIDLLAKIVMPFIACQNTTRPLLQMILLWLTCTGIHICSIIFAPYIDRQFCVVVQDLKLFNALTALAGIVASLIGDKKQLTSLLLWLFFFVMVVLLLVIQLNFATRTRIHVRHFLPETATQAKVQVVKANDRCGHALATKKG